VGIDQPGHDHPVGCVQHRRAIGDFQGGADRVDPIGDNQDVGAERLGAMLVVHGQDECVAEQRGHETSWGALGKRSVRRCWK
jgi:hypothetical protein